MKVWKQNCAYKSSITKNQLLHLLYVLGGTLMDNKWSVNLIPTLRSLCRRGLVETVGIQIVEAGLYLMDVVQFKLTERGERYLALWTPGELLLEVKCLEANDEFSFRRTYCHLALYYIISISPLEFLPEFLADEDVDVRIWTKKRQQELLNES